MKKISILLIIAFATVSIANLFASSFKEFENPKFKLGITRACFSELLNPNDVTILFNNFITSPQTICAAATPTALIGTTPFGGTGIFTYSWLSSTTSAYSGYSVTTGVNTQIDYSPGALTQTTWYRRLVMSGGESDTSFAIKITVKPISSNIISFSPFTGPVGTLVTITGTNLFDPDSLTIGGAKTIVVSNTSTSILAMIMPGTTNTGSVVFATGCSTAIANGSFSVSQTPFPSMQEGNKLVGATSSNYVWQGSGVALSADGNTAIVGGLVDSGGVGCAWIYAKISGQWVQQGNKLVGTGAVGMSRQGGAVSISADGKTAIVGGEYDNNFAGAAWIFVRNGNAWIQQGNKLVGSGAVGGAWQGCSVGLSADGTTAIIGGHMDNYNKGAGWIFKREENVWTQVGNKLVGTGAIGNADQGRSVALSADGNTAILGGVYDSNNAGASWVFSKNNGAWTQQGSKLTGNDANGVYIYQGSAVALSADGNMAIVGGSSDNSGSGAAWIYTRNGATWSQLGNKIVGTTSIVNSAFGCAVSLSADGNTAIVGSYYDGSDTGAAWVFTRNGISWTQQGTKLIGTGAIGSDIIQGWAVALSADGNTAMVGGPGDNNYLGATWVYISDELFNNVSENKKEENILVYPNPNNGIFNLKFEKAPGNINYEVTSSEGKYITQKNNVSDQVISIDLNKENAGVYFLKIETDKAVKVLKLLKL